MYFLEVDVSGTCIEDCLFLGNIEAMESEKFLKTNGIKIVISVINKEIENQQKFDSIEYHWICAEDTPTQDLLSHFEETTRIISCGQYTKRPVLVHCRAGVSRSATIVIAYIMFKYKMKLTEAQDFVQSKREEVFPNRGFKRQLQLWEDMGFILDPNNKTFRRYLIENLSFTYVVSNSIPIYFSRRDCIETLRKVEFGQEYRCSCKQTLFTGINLIQTDNKSVIECKNLFIEPQDWMQSTLIRVFVQADYSCLTLKCPNCKNIVCYFNEFFNTYKCDCAGHNYLSCLHFKMDETIAKCV